ncbi:hypothetical protein KQX54_002398 [Cotesia glomerata]|uniref:Uncharacterized protein n=1 Tax=Cotesia glomerata TaxID=32391 RepID=A0AAV7I6K4_COTGL|nr:hypothetical protein KQX54_002398 [Cotesia glomerata]
MQCKFSELWFRSHWYEQDTPEEELTCECVSVSRPRPLSGYYSCAYSNTSILVVLKKDDDDKEEKEKEEGIEYTHDGKVSPLIFHGTCTTRVSPLSLGAGVEVKDGNTEGRPYLIPSFAEGAQQLESGITNHWKERRKEKGIEEEDIKAITADMCWCWYITRMQEPQSNVSYTRIHQSDDKAASVCALLQYYLQYTSQERGKGRWGEQTRPKKRQPRESDL